MGFKGFMVSPITTRTDDHVCIRVIDIFNWLCRHLFFYKILFTAASSTVILRPTCSTVPDSYTLRTNALLNNYYNPITHDINCVIHPPGSNSGNLLSSMSRSLSSLTSGLSKVQLCHCKRKQKQVQVPWLLRQRHRLSTA